MSSIFEKIVAGEIPCHKVWEDKHHLAFLDIAPVHHGHTLVIPKVRTDYLFDLDDDAYVALWRAVRTVEAKVRKATNANRIIVHVEGYEVPHCHVHLIPTQAGPDYVQPPRKNATADELAEIAREIAHA